MAIVLNGTTGIVQANLGTNVAGTGPAFSAYQSTSQSVSTGTWTAVPLQTEFFDTASCFNNTGSTVGGIPAYSFLPTVAGYYQISGNATVGQVGTYYQTVSIYKNGTADKNGSITFASAISFPTANASGLIYLNGSTDYVTLYVLHGQGASQSTLGNSSSTFFTGALVRSA